ncbi:hypothetical protein BT67DRAFT_99022 [Trichocladium antarcticum]|uniref:Uncharacterized protein n=1 Tax=Trichocladium antarcticum TaxID=1450529 RepID=A0AAN6UQR5_9PEZI|nr:hypothetical protein BT67DRAFT_99022 [Trichocladium antarcticum]
MEALRGQDPAKSPLNETLPSPVCDRGETDFGAVRKGRKADKGTPTWRCAEGRGLFSWWNLRVFSVPLSKFELAGSCLSNRQRPGLAGPQTTGPQEELPVTGIEMGLSELAEWGFVRLLRTHGSERLERKLSASKTIPSLLFDESSFPFISCTSLLKQKYQVTGCTNPHFAIVSSCAWLFICSWNLTVLSCRMDYNALHMIGSAAHHGFLSDLLLACNRLLTCLQQTPDVGERQCA